MIDFIKKILTKRTPTSTPVIIPNYKEELLKYLTESLDKKIKYVSDMLELQNTEDFLDGKKMYVLGINNQKTIKYNTAIKTINNYGDFPSVAAYYK
jgi:hypothetical protein